MAVTRTGSTLTVALSALVVAFVDRTWAVQLNAEQATEIVALLLAGAHGITAAWWWAWDNLIQPYLPEPRRRPTSAPAAEATGATPSPAS